MGRAVGVWSSALVAAAVAVMCAACGTTTASGPASERTGSPTAPTADVHTAPGVTGPAGPVSPSSASPSSASPSSVPPSSVPPVSTAARADGLVDIRSVVPDAIVDLRYATSDNFTHVQLYPSDARCLVHESMANGLAAAAAGLRTQGFVLVLWDCYRPHAAQVRMFEVVPDPAWVARPGPSARSHEAGRSVDVTLAVASVGGTCQLDQRVAGRCLLDMGTGFDDFTPRAPAFATDGVSSLAHRHRAVLREAMAAGGLRVYSGEWWHFDGPGAEVGRPILAAPVN